jgi:hypothetical protein
MKLKQAIIGVLAFLALIGGAYGITEIFVLKPVYELEMAGVSQQIIQMQKNTQTQRAEDQVFYWMRIENQLIRDCAAAPNWKKESCRQRLNEARRQRLKAESHLERLRMP